MRFRLTTCWASSQISRPRMASELPFPQSSSTPLSTLMTSRAILVCYCKKRVGCPSSCRPSQYRSWLVRTCKIWLRMMMRMVARTTTLSRTRASLSYRRSRSLWERLTLLRSSISNWACLRRLKRRHTNARLSSSTKQWCRWHLIASSWTSKLASKMERRTK